MTTIQLFKSNLNGQNPIVSTENGIREYVAPNGARLTLTRDKYDSFMREALNLPKNRRIFVIEYFQA